MANICQFVCPYRTPISGYCGSTGGYAICPHRKMDEPPTIKSVEPIRPMTNADKYFRRATDEELARLIVDDWCELINCDCQIDRSLHWTCDGKCEERVLNWLKQEVESDE